MTPPSNQAIGLACIALTCISMLAAAYLPNPFRNKED